VLFGGDPYFLYLQLDIDTDTYVCVERVAVAGSSAEPGLGPLCHSPPGAPHHAVQVRPFSRHQCFMEDGQFAFLPDND
jgi:hypothetical protein